MYHAEMEGKSECEGAENQKKAKGERSDGVLRGHVVGKGRKYKAYSEKVESSIFRSETTAGREGEI